MSKRWDYHVMQIKPDMLGRVKPEQLQAELKRLGAQGWELVAMHAFLPGMGSSTAVFKREA